MRPTYLVLQNRVNAALSRPVAPTGQGETTGDRRSGY